MYLGEAQLRVAAGMVASVAFLLAYVVFLFRASYSAASPRTAHEVSFRCSTRDPMTPRGSALRDRIGHHAVNCPLRLRTCSVAEVARKR